jgi:hypothetical protein
VLQSVDTSSGVVETRAVRPDPCSYIIGSESIVPKAVKITSFDFPTGHIVNRAPLSSPADEAQLYLSPAKIEAASDFRSIRTSSGRLSAGVKCTGKVYVAFDLCADKPDRTIELASPQSISPSILLPRSPPAAWATISPNSPRGAAL